MGKNKEIYLIDGHSICYRAFYAISDLSTSKGMPTNAIYGFINIYKKLEKDYSPKEIVVVFDPKGPTKRHEKYKEYKAQRKPMPDELKVQIPKIKEILEANGVPVFEQAGYEADDVIATLTHKAQDNDYDVVIVTSDKDALQLVNQRVKALSLSSYGDKIYDSDAVQTKFGVTPEKMLDYLALTGDVSDNVPGVKGIGKITASKLINEYGSLKNLYKNIDEVSSSKTKEKLLEGKENAELSRDLIELDLGVPVIFAPNEWKKNTINTVKLADLYRELEFDRLLKEVTNEEVVEIDNDYIEILNEKQLEEVRSFITKKKVLCYVMQKNSDGKIFFAFGIDERIYCLDSSKIETKEFLVDVFSNDIFLKIGHDIKKDILGLAEAKINISGNIFDLMIGSYLLDPSLPKYDLENVALRRLGVDLVSVSQNTDKNGNVLMDFDNRNIFPALVKRICVMKELYPLILKELEEKGLQNLFNEVESPLIYTLANMEKKGVKIDKKYLLDESKKIDNKLKKLSVKIYKIAGEDFNINSPKQLSVILYEKLKLPVLKKTKTGASTDESVLSRLSSLHELPQVLLEYREINKLKTAYYDSILSILGENDVLHAKFNQAVTATGRLSSSEPNLQNIPIKTELGIQIRGAFIPSKKDNVLIAADYSQVELRVLAHIANDKDLIRAFNEGEDIHNYTASLIFDVKLAEVTAEMRRVAKTVNFGIVYGISAFGLAKDLDIHPAEASRFIEAYFNRYKGVKKFIDKTISDTRKKGYVETLLSRRRYIPEINSKNEHIKSFSERAAVNTVVQGSAADIIKLAMLRCSKEIETEDVSMIIQVHDELVFDVPKNMKKEVCRKIAKIMREVFSLKVPLEVDLEIGENWKDMESFNYD